MWGNFKSFASEALETAKDLKAHIHEITTEDSAETEAERSILLKNFSEDQLSALHDQVQRLTSELQHAKALYNDDISRLSAIITDLRAQLQAQAQLLKAKEGEVDWITQSYQAQLQELVRAKSLLQTEIAQLLEDSKQSQMLADEGKKTAGEVECLRQELSAVREELESERFRGKQIAEELEKERSHQEEHIDRAFFLQFIEMYNRNLANFRIREEMLESLISQLALSPQEQERLGIEPKPPEAKLPASLQSGLLDSFKQFLLGD